MKLIMLSGGVDSTTCLALAKETDKYVMAISLIMDKDIKQMNLMPQKKSLNFIMYNIEL